MELTRRGLLVGIPAAALLGLAGCSTAAGAATTRAAAAAAGASAPTRTPSPPPRTGFDKSAHSIDDPGSIWVVVDKRRPLQPIGYVPPDLVTVRNVPYTNPPRLRKEAAVAVERMFAAAKADSGVVLVSNSTYRSHAYQGTIFAQDVAQLGTVGANRIDMLPGYSEHQAGLAIDIGTHDGTCDFNTCMGHADEGVWLAANAWRYGFLMSYPADREARTGISWEPWHYRYVGIPLATELHRTGTQTLEEFFGLPPSPTYR